MYFYNPDPNLNSQDQLVTLDAQEKLELFVREQSEDDDQE